MNTIIWEVLFHSPPEVSRRCAKCGENARFKSSGRFRINAQQRHLDVWLVYKCVRCKSTWNLTIYTRVSPIALGRELLDRFTANDEALAWQYAMDGELLRRNGAQAGEVSYSVIGEAADPGSDARVILVSRYATEIKISKLLREKLALSKKAFDDMASRGALQLESGEDIQKARLRQKAVLLISSSGEGQFQGIPMP